MITAIYGRDKEVERFVADNIEGCSRGFGECKAIGFAREGKLVAGVVYHNWDEAAGVIEISSASICRDWATKTAIRRIFEYPFDQIGCQMCIARISENNTRARRIWKAFGATEYKIPRLRGRDEAETIHTLTIEAWRSGKFKRIS